MTIEDEDDNNPPRRPMIRGKGPGPKKPTHGEMVQTFIDQLREEKRVWRAWSEAKAIVDAEFSDGEELMMRIDGRLPPYWQKP